MDSAFLCGLLAAVSYASYCATDSLAFPAYAAALLLVSALTGKGAPGVAMGVGLPAALAHLQTVNLGRIAASRELEVLPFALCLAAAAEDLPAGWTVAAVAATATAIGVFPWLHVCLVWAALLGVLCLAAGRLRAALRLSQFEHCLVLYALGSCLADLTAGPVEAEAAVRSLSNEVLRVVELGVVSTAALGLAGHWLSAALHVGPLGKLTGPSYCLLAAAVLVYLAAMLWGMQMYLGRSPLGWVYQLCVVRDGGAAVAQGLVWCVLILSTAPLARISLERWRWPSIVTRKLFHFLAVAMFVPPLTRPALGPFVSLAFGVALCAFALVEYARALMAARSLAAFVPVLDGVISYLGVFTKRDAEGGRRYVIWDHLTLLLGCAVPAWRALSRRALSPPQPPLLPLLPFLGLVSVGVGDAAAAIAGQALGRHKWTTGSGRSLEGSAGACASMLLSAGLVHWGLWGVQGVEATREEATAVLLTVVLITFIEALTRENDNLVVVLYAVGCYEATSLMFATGRHGSIQIT